MPRTSTRILLVLALVPALASGANLVLNGPFDADITGWSPTNWASTKTWSPTDESGNPPSGALRMTNLAPNVVITATSNCFAVTPGKHVVYGASARGPLGGTTSDQTARTSIEFYDGPNCTGSKLIEDYSDVTYTLRASTWGPTQGTAAVPATAQSAFMQLRIGAGASPPSEVFFDNAFVYEDETCGGGAYVVCLNDRRFRVVAQWKTPEGTEGYGALAPFTADSARATFFGPDNVELVVKVLEACAINDRYWVFAAGLTNVEVTLRVTDTLNGETWTHHSPLDQAFLPEQDVNALESCPH